MKFSVYFVPSDRPKDGEAGIRMRISAPSFTVYYSLGYRINLDAWSKETQRVKKNTFHSKMKIPATTINEKIGKWEQLAIRIIAKDEDISLADFRKIFGEATGKTRKVEKPLSIFDIYKRFTIEEGSISSWTESTIKSHNSTMSHLQKYSKSLTFDDLTEEGMAQFVVHMIGAGLGNRTIQKYVKNLKWFLRWAVKKKYTKDTGFDEYKLKLKIPKRFVVFLNWEELTALYNYECQSSFHSKVRDFFCFCCFSGLRYSDVAKLKKSDIHEDRIHSLTLKDTDCLTIELNKYSKAILERYKDSDSIYALPVMPMQDINREIKKICKEVGINEIITLVSMSGSTRKEETGEKYKFISTHAGRRTFICNALVMGIAPSIVMKWTGHNDFKAMIPYIDVAGVEKKEAMDKFDHRL